MKRPEFPTIVLFVMLIAIFDICNAKPNPSLSIHETLNLNSTTHPWPNFPQLQFNFNPSFRSLLAGFLSFLAAAISSAGGIGGGGLIIPILILAAGFDLNTASSYSAFMVTGVLVANIACSMLSGRRVGGSGALIDYDIALLSEPCMLLGVSCGVLLNLVLPEWLITVFFAIFLAFCTFKTCKSGISFWKKESENEEAKLPLLRNEEENDKGDSEIPWVKLGMMLLIWFAFFVLYLIGGNTFGQGIINIEACGTGYWVITSLQIPLALMFTAWILHLRKTWKNSEEVNEIETRSTASSRNFFFPLMALFVGVLGGVFGIGGGMFISPLLLQLGKEPQVAAATCSFMIFFSTLMSAMQYLMLGMEDVYGALGYAVICFVASLIGMTLARQAVMKLGRASLIVFSVAVVMALSTLLITGYGAVNAWNDYTTGKAMGFNNPC